MGENEEEKERGNEGAVQWHLMTIDGRGRAGVADGALIVTLLHVYIRTG